MEHFCQVIRGVFKHSCISKNHRKINVTSRSMNSHENIFQENNELLMNVKPLITAFQLCGIDFLDNTTDLNENLCPILLAFCMKICAYIICILRIMRTVYSICHANTDSNIIFFSNRLVEILNVSLFFSLVYKRKSIWRLLLHIFNVHRKINPNTTILKKTHISLVIAIIFGSLVMSYAFVYLSRMDSIKTYLKNVFSDLPSENMSTYSLCVLAIIDFLTFLILESSSMYFDLLYSVICRILRGLIKEYIRKFKSDAFETLCDNHTVIFEAISYADRCLSFPLFINLFFHVDLLYFLCVWFMKNYDGDSVMLKIYMKNQLIINFISFLAITLSATQVHDEMQKLKDMTRSWRSGNQRHLTVNQKITLMLKIDDVSLTVWGAFNITKNFIISAFGAILTYSVLISSLTD